MSSDGSVSIEELIARLEKASGPDREIDFDIWCMEHGFQIVWESNRAFFAREQEHGPIAFIDPTERSRNFYLNSNYEKGVPCFTASLDAIVSLIERKLPGWGWFLRREPDGSWSCSGLTFPDAPNVTPGAATAKMPTLALCLAFLKALQAKGAQS